MTHTGHEWFQEAKYGLFIHWGLYSILAGEYKGQRTRHIPEWIMNTFHIPPEEYRKLAEQFCPDRFDADELVRMAKEEWGMKYLVLTSKHHEGFAMYHSEVSAYNIVDATPYKKDVLAQLAQACEKYGMKLGLYYSQAQDWDEPYGYVSNSNGGSIPQGDITPELFQIYLDEKVKPQLRELLTRYGEIGLIWFDTPMSMTREQSLECVDFVKSIQPDCLISGRIGNHLGDYMSTADNCIPRLPYLEKWEVPATLNDSWGFKKFDQNWKSSEEVLRLLLKINSRGGNYLLNIGPDEKGNIPEETKEILGEVGAYVRENGEGIFGTVAMEVYPYEIDWAEITYKPHKMYLHMFVPRKTIHVLGCANRVTRAYVLRGHQEVDACIIKSCEGDSVLEIRIPEQVDKGDFYCVCVEYEEERAYFEPLSK